MTLLIVTPLKMLRTLEVIVEIGPMAAENKDDPTTGTKIAIRITAQTKDTAQTNGTNNFYKKHQDEGGCSPKRKQRTKK